MLDGWKVSHGLNPMDATGVNSPSYRVVVGQQQDQYTTLEKHGLYYDAGLRYDASYDPLKLTGTGDVRPVVTISQSEANPYATGTFTIRRDVGTGSLSNPLVVYFAVDGNLVYKRDYVILVSPGVTFNDSSSPFAITIPSDEASVEVTLVVTPPAVPANNLIVTLVPYSSVQ